MPSKEGKAGHTAADSVSPSDREAFAESLKQRRRAADGLEQDLLTQVPVLYGSPGSLEPRGDPGIVLAQAHHEELVRRNGGGVLHRSSKHSEVALPFERLIIALTILICLILLFF
ncbi:hypothetical protein [Sphingosinicella sp. LY1275]|uniref:hypothetical protein n=1 Tax=Sphingosinicella sp. LY1275 TaxID=3095379 RepID=UPI002ADEC0F0|nr:hypothetical protein [Sphingosinicella sp. LY1275]MEA1013732.1 hypothetical protein [Sphingosinicella sp. LY1275]